MMLATPGNDLVLDTLIMYGLVDRLFEDYYWVEGEVILQGQRYLISLERLRPQQALPSEVKLYVGTHSCGRRAQKRGETADLKISPVSGKFQRTGPRWSPAQYRICSTCKNLARRGQSYAGERDYRVKGKVRRECWVLSPANIRVPLVLSVKALQIPQSVTALEKAELPAVPALLTLLSILPSPLPGKSWLFSIYTFEGNRIIRASLGIRTDNIHAFVWLARRKYLRFSSLIRELVRLEDQSPLVKLADVAMMPSLSLAYTAIRAVRRALGRREGTKYDFRNFDKLANALVEWCRSR